MTDLFTIKDAAKYLNVSQDTLRKWDRDGKLKPLKTCGKHRRYLLSSLNNIIGINEEKTIEKQPTITAVYSRVSSHDQKQHGDLDRQCQRLCDYCANNKLVVEHIIKDVGSGLSDERSGFIKLTNLVINKKINNIIIENKDRLTRFQFNFIEKMFASYGVSIICIDKKDISEEEEFVNDVMMLMASFSGKLYGRRSAKRKQLKNDTTK